MWKNKKQFFHIALDYAELGIIQVIPSTGLFRVEWTSKLGTEIGTLFQG